MEHEDLLILSVCVRRVDEGVQASSARPNEKSAGRTRRFDKVLRAEPDRTDCEAAPRLPSGRAASVPAPAGRSATVAIAVVAAVPIAFPIVPAMLLVLDVYDLLVLDASVLESGPGCGRSSAGTNAHDPEQRGRRGNSGKFQGRLLVGFGVGTGNSVTESMFRNDSTEAPPRTKIANWKASAKPEK